MDKKTEYAPPSYDNEGAPSYEDAPSYAASTSTVSTGASRTGAGPTLVLDPTGMFIKQLPSSDDAPPLYTLSASLLNVNLWTSIHVQRPVVKGGETTSLDVYAIGNHFISPLHTRKQLLQDITVARSSGLFALTHLREIVWDFSTYIIPRKPQTGGQPGAGESFPPTADGFLIGLITDPAAVQHHLLRFYSGKWVAEDDEVLALEREGGPECEGMPVLSVSRPLDHETMDFLVSAWCVKLWGEAGKRARKAHSAKGVKGK